MRLSKRSTCWIVDRLSFLEDRWSTFAFDSSYERNPHLLHPVPWISSKKILPKAIRRSSLWILEATVEGFAAALREENIVQRYKPRFSRTLDGLQRQLYLFRSCTWLWNTYWKERQMDLMWRSDYVYLHLRCRFGNFWNNPVVSNGVPNSPEEGSMNRSDLLCQWSAHCMVFHHARCTSR